MLQDVRQIRHPLLRGIATGFLASAIVTITTGTAMAVSNIKDESAYKLALSASVVSAVGGAVFGLIAGTTDEKISNKGRKTLASDTETKVWKDWRNFVVVRKEPESEVITSFYLKPEDGGEIPNYLPGQFLTIQLNIPEQSKPVIRTYSLSDFSKECESYRLSIKREAAPKGLEVPPGVASNFMHDRIQEGSVIQAKPPNGKFVLDVKNSLPAILISNGVGITPTIAMAKACSQLNSQRHIWFVHGARDGKLHAFLDEVGAIASQYPNLHIHYAYSRPRPEDKGRYQSVGYADINLIQEVILPEIQQIYGSTAAEYFLCGSPPFMQSLREGLKAVGVPDNRVFFEAFAKAPASPTVAPPTVGESEVVFAKSGTTLTWKSGDSTLLEFAEANNLNPPYSCRAGICLTCMCRIKEGEVEYLEPPTGTPDEGSVLICISQPKTPKVVLDL